MKMKPILALVALALAATVHFAFGLSSRLTRPEIFFPKNHDTNQVEQLHTALRSDRFKFLGGLTSYWQPQWSTTMVYEGDGKSLNAFLESLNRIDGITVRLTFSHDLSKETGSALQAGSWWAVYSHTLPDTITVRVNLAAEALGGDKFEMNLPKTKP